MPIALSGLSAIADDYDAILCDVWGVLHDGIHAHLDAADALRRFREKGPVVLMTNAPRPSSAVRSHLASLGAGKDAYDAILSSGDVVIKTLAEKDARRIYHIGPDRDLGLYNDAMTLVSDPEAADAVVIAGLRDDTVETPDDYRDEMARIAASGTPVLCANPDIVVERGDELVWCAGALAKLVEAAGRDAIWIGKPHGLAYDAAREKIFAHRPDAGRILVIGDGLPTDIRGASNQGYDALFLTDGIHAREVGGTGTPDPELVAERLAKDGLDSRYYAPRLSW
ncbi:TIGR01459 family HAD-type hydrolase [Acuticoccus sediminis]|uniref:TIGR01459 family HAD-type hydrolase n=1 Tax=Acuticoccus sediminis TaxID=2184697 RepID=A0A8B2NWQ0_9HYPH|nr:TIGR01459 family HAD-type hydrolase [Acuticoccus sediminis]RAI03100.1 TIGR01459 family HAD-type hydrolase [Acuticoccus sediminis]